MRFAFVALSLPVCLSGPAAPQEVAPFVADFPDETERVWIGPDFYANRLLDWRLSDGRLECLEGSPGKPLRTVHLLTRSLRPGPGDFEVAVRLGIVDMRMKDPSLWAGFLVGIGGADVDWRTSALCHHWPGENGGLLAVFERRYVSFRENGHGDGPRGPRADLTREAWPKLDAEMTSNDAWRALEHDNSILEWVDLTLRGRVDHEVARLDLEVRTGLAARSVQIELPADRLTGGIALVSHGSPRRDGKGFAFRDFRASGSKLEHHPERAFGPVMGAMYTLSGGTLKLTAQMGPLGAADERTARLRVRRGDEWVTAATGVVQEPSFTVPFRVEGWDASEDTPYRIEYDLRVGPDRTEGHVFDGTIRRDPVEADELVLAGLSCHDISSAGDKHWNNDHIWWPHADLVENLSRHDPDMLFFAGDQIYEGGLAGIVRRPTELATLDYLYHWFRFVWAFRDLMRDRPTVCLPDDHDVYHGNIWGNGGEQAPADPERYRRESDRGGYIMDPVFVNAVHATQVSHLPDPVDPTPIKKGISVYFTRLDYGGLSFAIVADRMFKSAPATILPEGEVVNGWFQNPDFDPVTQADLPWARLLGDRQLAFLDSWVDEQSDDAAFRVLLSQTVFSNIATIPGEASSGSVLPRLQYAAPGEYVAGDKLAADCDSGGWPQSGRNRALRILQRGNAFHIAGDQHLPSFQQYGLEEWRDGPYAFCVPAIANLWPRRFFPPNPGGNRTEGSPLYTGDHRDGFGNRMTVMAVANPMQSGVEPRALNDRNPGYGIVRFAKEAGTITSECWPRWVDPRAPDAAQFTGWPITVRPGR